jgi:hypothetical protein
MKNVRVADTFCYVLNIAAIAFQEVVIFVGNSVFAVKVFTHHLRAKSNGEAQTVSRSSGDNGR